jgi:hypothetical protein
MTNSETGGKKLARRVQFSSSTLKAMNEQVGFRCGIQVRCNMSSSDRPDLVGFECHLT